MIEPEYLGQRLIEKGFRTWFLYMFRLIEQRPFIEEELHEGLFEVFTDIYQLEELRISLNLPPRSSKTTLAIYLIAFSLAQNPKCNFIYTSYSQDLLGQISTQVANILNHPVYRKMYGQNYEIEEFEESPINKFWKDYLFEATGKDKYTAKKIITSEGGVILFTSIGSAITGFGAGIRGAKKFSGCLILDDPNKPADVRSERMREKVKIYYQETLLSRLNDSNVPIINIQQRLHLEDLSGILKDVYDFKVLKKALIDGSGKCTLPSQYTQKRLEEIQKDNYVFVSQYQQEPIVAGGTVIETKYFNYYQTLEGMKFSSVFMTGDTAQKTKEANDFSVLCLWGVYQNNLYLIDMIRGKWEAPQLELYARAFWDKWKLGVNGRCVNAMYIEDKSSGTGLIQTLKIRTSIPIIGVKVSTDKYTRVTDVTPQIVAGRVYLPFSPDHGFVPTLLKECEEFSADMSHKHDDIVDNIAMGILKGLGLGSYNIADLL